MKIAIAIAVGAAALVILVILVAGRLMERSYRKDVFRGKERIHNRAPAAIIEKDLEHLPQLVRDYLIAVGVTEQPKVLHMKAVFGAEMRNRNQDWFHLEVEQHNFFDEYERFFYLKARLKGLPVKGYHRYSGGKASMRIKLFGLIPVVQSEGGPLFTAETVTFLNDMCFLAPATLIDKNIVWEEIDSVTVRATFTNHSVKVSAILRFNQDGQLVNFISEDRTDISENKKYRFSTPLSKFEKIGEITLPTYGEAIWHYPEGPFVYGKYTLKQIEYNPR